MCPLSKHTRLLFSNKNNRCNEPFDLIQVDIWGDYSVPSLSGAQYFLTFVDDYSRCTWLYLMRHKSETQIHLNNFYAMIKTQFQRSIRKFAVIMDLNLYLCLISLLNKAMIKTQFQHSIKKVYSDNGLEFISMSHFFIEQGIMYQQNGITECKRCKILEVACALRFQAFLPLKFLGECVLTATYIL